MPCSFILLLFIFSLLGVPIFGLAQDVAADTTATDTDSVDWSVYVPQIVIFSLIFALAAFFTFVHGKSRDARKRSSRTKQKVRDRIRETALRNAEEAEEEQSRED
ncbi:hypothetical protein GF324_01380 [bacterium]|nr:hypothetical protein [bacterium]